MKRLEALCDAVAAYHHYFEPESEAYELRNPGLLLGENGKRKFSCHRAGYAAFLDRMQKRCAANPQEPIVTLLDSIGIKMRRQQEETLDFMGRCANSSLKLETTLSWFIEDGNG